MRATKLIALQFILPCVCCSGCSDADPPEPVVAENPEAKKQAEEVDFANYPPTADFWLSSADIEQFEHGRSIEEIFRAIKARGNIRAAGVVDGKIVMAVSYGFFKEENLPTTAWAIFVNGEFEKFIAPLVWDKKPQRVGEQNELARAYESESIAVAQLKENRREIEKRIHRDPNWGLTAVALFFGSLAMLRDEVDEDEIDTALKQNAKLRNQFHPIRIKIGMTEEEVDEAFEAEPIGSGEVEAGKFAVYGSIEKFNLRRHAGVHYQNVLVVFADGKVTDFYTIDSGVLGYHWAAYKIFSDLPIVPLY